jgi:hypothetical protein
MAPFTPATRLAPGVSLAAPAWAAQPRAWRRPPRLARLRDAEGIEARLPTPATVRGSAVARVPRTGCSSRSSRDRARARARRCARSATAPARSIARLSRRGSTRTASRSTSSSAPEFNAIPGYVTGECFGVATVAVRGRLPRMTRRAPRHCRLGQARSSDTGPPPPRMTAPAPEAAAIRARTADPWHRAPNTGGVGDRPLFVPPWALLVWSGRDGSRCYEPGQ